jgi:NAD(P)-dependent dehydrogenase (short-subunit alcohol dehydrogenase family)
MEQYSTVEGKQGGSGGAARVVLVTGGASGIGRAAVEAFAAGGDIVVSADRVLPAAASTEPSPGAVADVVVDVTDDDAVAAVVRDVVAAHGRLDVAFNNAGITGPPARLHELAPSEWRRVLAVDLDGVYFCMRHELAQMTRQGGGVIVNTSSAAVHHAPPTLAAYAAAKHGVVGLTRTAAVEYAADGIRVNAVLPGVVRTPLLLGHIGDDARRRDYFDSRSPLGRMAEPAEVAALVVWLCSPGASYVTGGCYSVDGAATA